MVKGVGGSDSSAGRSMSPCLHFQPLCPQSPWSAASDHWTISVLQMLYMLYSLSCHRTSAQSCLIPSIWMLPPLLHGSTIIPSLAQLPQASPDDSRPTKVHHSKLFFSPAECPARVDQQTLMLSVPQDSRLQDSGTVGFCFCSGFGFFYRFSDCWYFLPPSRDFGMLQIPIRYFSSKRTGEWIDGWMDGWRKEGGSHEKGRGAECYPRQRDSPDLSTEAGRLCGCRDL